MKTPQEMLEKIGTVDFLDVDKLASYLCDLEKKIDSKMDNTVVLYEAPGSYAEGYKKGQIDEAIDHQTKDVQIVKESDTKWREGYLEALGDVSEKILKSGGIVDGYIADVLSDLRNKVK